MESKFQLLNNGQEVQTSDINSMSDSAALADDRVLAELLRMPPYDGSTVTKGVIPFTAETRSDSSDAFNVVSGLGVAGVIRVRPFRALVGSRTAEASDPKKNWRDIRSTIHIGSSATRDVQLGGFAAGHATLKRWDLVYAVITPDANAAGVTRYVKDPTTSVVAPVSVVTTKTTTVTLAIVTGTANASPALPAIPADGGGAYNIPICYVRIPVLWNPATDLIDSDWIYLVAPIVHISRALGVATVRPATSQFTANQTGSGPAGLSTAAIAAWGNTGTRPKINIQPNTIGSEKIIVALDLTDASSANWSIANYGTIDSSKDYRNCLFSVWAQAGRVNGGTANFSWVGTATVMVPGTSPTFPSDNSFAYGAGQSFQSQMSGVSGFAGFEQGIVFRSSRNADPSGNPANFLDFADDSELYVYVDSSDGALRFFARGGTVPRAYIFMCIEAIGPFPGW